MGNMATMKEQVYEDMVAGITAGDRYRELD